MHPLRRFLESVLIACEDVAEGLRVAIHDLCKYANTPLTPLHGEKDDSLWQGLRTGKKDDCICTMILWPLRKQ